MKSVYLLLDQLPYQGWRIFLPFPWAQALCRIQIASQRALVKTASKNYRKNPTNANALKLKTAQYQLAGIYIKEQTEYIQNQIDKIRDSVEDRQSRIAWQTINEVSRRKNTAKAKLKTANHQERIKLATALRKPTRKPTENNTWTNHQNN